jgi:hypothetical protein
MAATTIQDIHHNGPKKCPGIGQQGKFGHEQSRNQIKNHERTVGIANSKEQKQRQSARNVTYQTEHKKTEIQKQRVNLAVTHGLGGHLSGDRNSKKNQNTTGGLKRINDATRKQRL